MQLIVGGIQVAYTEQGVGENLIFIHGWLDSKETFKPLINNLSKDFHCVAVDLPNFGNSQQNVSVVTTRDYSKFISSFIKKLGLKDYTIVGHSMGGQILIYATGEGIIEPSKLILIASAGVRDRQQHAKLVLKYFAKLTKAFVPNKTKNFLYKKIGSDYQTNLSSVHKKIIKSALSTDVQNQATNVNCSTLLIYGELDKHTPPSFGQTLQSDISDSKLITIKYNDHWVHSKAAKEVALEIKEFINE